MSYITPARRMSRVPGLPSRVVVAARRQYADQNHALASALPNKSLSYADSETCILTGAMPGLQELSLCLPNEGDFCLTL